MFSNLENHALLYPASRFWQGLESDGACELRLMGRRRKPRHVLGLREI